MWDIFFWPMNMCSNFVRLSIQDFVVSYSCSFYLKQFRYCWWNCLHFLFLKIKNLERLFLVKWCYSFKYQSTDIRRLHELQLFLRLNANLHFHKEKLHHLIVSELLLKWSFLYVFLSSFPSVYLQWCTLFSFLQCTMGQRQNYIIFVPIHAG